jgi:hypothetical protein
VTALCAAPAVPVRGQAADLPAATAFEITIPDGEADHPYYRELISGFVRVELEEAGLHTITAQQAVTANQAPLGVEELLELAGAAGADLLAISRFSTREEQIRIDFAWYDVAARVPVAATSRSQAMDLSFDRIIQEGIAALLLASGPWLARLPVRSPQAPLASESPPPTAEEPLRLPEPVSSGPSAPSLRPKPGRWELGAGTGPFLTVGRASDYFKLGILPSISGSFRLGRPESPWRVGVFGAACWFRAAGAGSQGTAVLAPLGPELRFTSAGERPLGVILRISGGPALFSLSPEYQASKTKLIPFLLGGMGLLLPLGSRLALALEPIYLVFFEPQAPIMGFMPSGSIYVRW